MAAVDRKVGATLNPRSQEDTLSTLFGVIAKGDRPTASRLLAEYPLLARQAIKVGATRNGGGGFFIEAIAHHVYGGDTPLHVAAAAYQREVAQDLVSRGADVSARNRRGAEPLHYASDGSLGSDTWDPAAQHAIIELLIKAGADPNSADKSGVAPLHRAVRTRCTGAVRALLLNGADARKRNKNGSTPLHLAVQNTGRGGSGSPASREQQAAIIRLLLEHGARPSDRDAAGKSVRACVTTDWIHSLLGKA